MREFFRRFFKGKTPEQIRQKEIQRLETDLEKMKTRLKKLTDSDARDSLLNEMIATSKQIEQLRS